MRIFGDFLAYLVDMYSNFYSVMFAETVFGFPLIYVLLGGALGAYIGYVITKFLLDIVP